mgnify:CR=1 FL=1
MQQDIDILLVEDSPTDAELACRALSQRLPIERLAHVEDGQQALDFLFSKDRFENRESSLRVVLLDLKLPKIDGIEVLRQIKNDETLKAIPVVALTSSTLQRDIDQCYQLGVNSFVTKPVQYEKFMQVIADLGVYWMLCNEPPNCDKSETQSR